MTTALLVIDVQNGFCDPGGSVARLGMRLVGVDAAIANAARAVKDAHHRHPGDLHASALPSRALG